VKRNAITARYDSADVNGRTGSLAAINYEVASQLTSSTRKNEKSASILQGNSYQARTDSISQVRHCWRSQVKLFL